MEIETKKKDIEDSRTDRFDHDATNSWAPVEYGIASFSMSNDSSAINKIA